MKHSFRNSIFYFLLSALLFYFLFSTFYFLDSNIVLASTTDGTINAVYKYAWAKNLGWLNFGTSGGNVHITDTVLTGNVWSSNYGWIKLNPTKAGVTNNGEGTLSGSAWGENCGWINFNGVTIDSNGEFSGYASGSISGDISFECADNCIVKTDWRPRSARPACNNALDDDGDGKIDYPADPGCSSLDDTDETDVVTPPGGGGGGGGGAPAPITQIVFSGRAYPLSRVTTLKDGQIAITTIAGLDANFNVALSNLSAGNYIFSVFSEDSQARRSSSFNFPVIISQGATTTISGIFLSPTIDVDKIEVRRGDNIVVLGQSVPQGEVTIDISSDEEFFVKTKADKNGAYLSYFDTSPLVFGQHLAKSKTSADGLISSYSPAVGFAVGTKSVPKVPTKCPPKADLNSDCRVNLIDFSIAAYWYKRTLSESFKKIEKEKLNGDGKVTLVDFSIMAYYWTG